MEKLLAFLKNMCPTSLGSDSYAMDPEQAAISEDAIPEYPHRTRMLNGHEILFHKDSGVRGLWVRKQLTGRNGVAHTNSEYIYSMYEKKWLLKDFDHLDRPDRIPNPNFFSEDILKYNYNLGLKFTSYSHPTFTLPSDACGERN